jgi:hypothetical protein
MRHKKAVNVIRKAFAHINVENIVVEYDPLVEAEVAKVFVRNDQLPAALRKNGFHARQAAVNSGLSVEVVVSNPKPKALKRKPVSERDGAPAAVGRFILHRFCGDEEYVIKTATILAVKEETGLRLWFEAETEGVCIKSVPDTADLKAWPKAEVGVSLMALDASKLVGRRFNVLSGYDEEEESYVATIYYVEHQELRRNKIEVLGQEDDIFLIRWTGVTTDVDYYDGGKPETKLEIEGRFTFSDMEEWIPALGPDRTSG